MTDLIIADSDRDFLLWDWLSLSDLLKVPRLAGHDRETIDAVLSLSADLAEKEFLPHYKAADKNEPWQDESGGVHVLPELAAALRQYAELGLFSASFAEELGGMNLPFVVSCASQAHFMAANISAAAYPMLTAANARVIAAFGDEEQIKTFARPQIAGATFGTMCLSEPQAGSSLGDIRTKAVEDGASAYGPRYRLFGTKMWISGGDQDISDNIVHLVLAKIPDENGQLPAGTKGISLFITPKFLPSGERNDVVIAGLNHKMGYRGTANCLVNFGEGRFTPEGGAGCIGYRIGAPGQGLAIMFQMMNEARISVGLGAAALAYRGYRHAVQYAKDRSQGRALGAAKAGGDPIAIIEHPDVQRMLLAQKCYAEGALALVLYCAALVDRAHDDADSAAILALLTPVAKTWPSEWGLVANDLAIQVHGGYGYTRDFDVEQLYRDNRLNPIHEGTTGIQAIDLLQRKLLRSDGKAYALLRGRVDDTLARARNQPALTAHAETLRAAWDRFEATLQTLTTAEERRALANATPFLFAFGHLVVGWLWLDQAATCLSGASTAPEAFRLGKVRACRFFMESELPKTAHWLAIAASLTDVALAAPADQF